LEDINIIIETLADDGAEATFSMGEDTPLAFISQKPRVLFDYFKQRFAQVTNPPIDPLREGLVMSLDVHLGKKGNILAPKPE
jgi:glutamate synthase (ferredoxin)